MLIKSPYALSANENQLITINCDFYFASVTGGRIFDAVVSDALTLTCFDLKPGTLKNHAKHVCKFSDVERRSEIILNKRMFVKSWMNGDGAR